MHTLFTVLHFLASFVLIIAVLLQSGKGGGIGAAFGGASTQIFGGRGAGNFLTRVTSAAAIVFFVTSLTLSFMSARGQSVVEEALTKPKPAATAGAGSEKEDVAPAPAAEENAAPAEAPAEESAPAESSAPSDSAPQQ